MIADILMAIVVLFFYFIPTINAFKRNHNNYTPIAIGNICFGWTIIGWLIMLMWSNTDNVKG